MTAWLAFLLGGLATYLGRASFILFGGERELPGEVERALRYVGPAVFAAIVVPAAIVGDEKTGVIDARLLALALGGLVMWRTRNMTLTLVSGMLALWTLQAVGV